jgi:hypothetical protein
MEKEISNSKGGEELISTILFILTGLKAKENIVQSILKYSISQTNSQEKKVPRHRALKYICNKRSISIQDENKNIFQFHRKKKISVKKNPFG